MPKPRPVHTPLDPEAIARRDERLRAAGIRVPDYRNAGPISPPVPQRPKWLSFTLRILVRIPWLGPKLDT